jgi:hypothetical protein
LGELENWEMRKLASIVFISIFLLECNTSEKKVAGIYIKEPSVNIIDSLFIYADSLQPTQVYNRKEYKYKQIFYNKKTGQLLFVNIGTWWLDKRIEFKGFYFDADSNPDDISYSKEAIQNALTSFSTSMDGENIMLDKGVHYKKVKINK